MQRSPYGQLLLFLLYKIQCSGFGCLSGGGLEAVNLCGPGGNGSNGKEGRKVGHCGKEGQDGAKPGAGENLWQS